ncbi:hypothetical protein [Maribellus maritimus]|uniref:hypothetical protein n=1 Tax=Maribellus maritimus TaxID=2870838 RepID=UPI001EEAD1DC|nr:hypothetical protein [Maribellus maritimus]MCG6190490.1 hypothetical protein [Maribellus maritimus]
MGRNPIEIDDIIPVFGASGVNSKKQDKLKLPKQRNNLYDTKKIDHNYPTSHVVFNNICTEEATQYYSHFSR